jgi:hypothetical protein
MAAETVVDAAHGEGALVDPAEAAIVLALSMNELGRDETVSNLGAVPTSVGHRGVGMAGEAPTTTPQV